MDVLVIFAELLKWIIGAFTILSVLGVGVAVLAVWGIAKLVGHVANRLPGKHKEQPLIRAPQPPHDDASTKARMPYEQHQQTPRTATTTNRRFVYFDVDAGATPKQIADVMRGYEQERVVGTYARTIISTLNSAELQRKGLFSQIDSEFQRGSISWDRFASTASKGLDAIVRNCALLANRVQSFDVDEYERMEHFYTTGAELRNGTQDPALIQRWALLRDTKAEMDGILSANEGLLLELGKLSAELSKLSRSETSDQSSQIAEEVSRLVEETKYYR